MNEAGAIASLRGQPLWVKLLAGLLVVAAALVLLVALFPWDLLRGPLNRYVSDKTGRHFEITRRLDVKIGSTTRVLADGIEFANPEWASDPNLVKAESAEIEIELLPLLSRRIVMPRVELRQPQLGLQIEPDGRRSWALGRDAADPRNFPEIGALVVDKGSVHFVAPAHGADIRTEFEIDGPLNIAPARHTGEASDDRTGAIAPSTAPGTATQAQMPLSFSAKGTWQKESFTAKGKTGNVLYLSAPLQRSFPMEVEAAAGSTRLRARGVVASLATLDGATAVFDLQGKNLADLYKLVGVVLPATPRYTLHGSVTKQGEVWRLAEISGKLGNTDMAGELAYDRAQKVPHLAGKLKSEWLDFNDLAPLVGLPEQPSSAAAGRGAQAVAAAQAAQRNSKRPKDPARKVLPTTPLDLARMKAMNAEVTYAAAKVTNAGKFPLERISAGVRLNDGVLNLEPLSLGIAGGTVVGRLHIDSHASPVVVQAKLNAKSLELNKLFRDVQLTKSSVGKISGDIDLSGRGNTVAQMLGSASGNFALLMGPGQISNLLMEFLGLDGAEILKFLVRGDENVKLRCAATAFDVKNGLMTSRALVLDTEDTVVYGEGNVNLATEAMHLYFKPYPKDTSILAMRGPLRIEGTLGAPQVGPDKGALAGRAAVALALGVINPLLALAATIETGPGEDANCGAILRAAASPNASAARADVKSQAQHQQERSAKLGGPPGKSAR